MQISDSIKALLTMVVLVSSFLLNYVYAFNSFIYSCIFYLAVFGYIEFIRKNMFVFHQAYLVGCDVKWHLWS